MSSPAVASADRLLAEGFAALHAAGGAQAADDDLLDVARVVNQSWRRAERDLVAVVADLDRRGVFAARGLRTVTGVTQLLGVEHAVARRLLVAADAVIARVDRQGQELPARLPATAALFAAGSASLRHVEVVAALLASAAASRLDPDVQAGVEEQIAAQIGDHTPGQLRTWGLQLIELLDQDGAAPDDSEPDPINKLSLQPHTTGTGGSLRGRFDDPALYEAIATIIDAKARPLTSDDHRPQLQRNAEALADICGYVAEHGDRTVAPETAGRRPQISVIARLEDLENRARAACLDFAGLATPAALRMLCCDADVIPIVMNGRSEPLDVGTSSRTVPQGMRRAVIARDRGCAHPGCDRTVSWSEIHHITPWEIGGETKLSNLVMLCKVHHRAIHFSGWSVRIAADGLPEFFPPLWLDSTRKPRRKPAMPAPPPRR